MRTPRPKRRLTKQQLGGIARAKKLREIFDPRDAEIRELAADGTLSQSDIARQFGISRQRVWQILSAA